MAAASETKFQKELDELKEKLLVMGGRVEWCVDGSARALKGLDVELAKKIIRTDETIDQLENAIDERCLRLLATRQPVAKDLRFIAAVTKICGCLERIADQAVNVADRTLVLAGLEKPVEISPTVMDMAAEAQEMVAGSLNALVGRDVAAARAICRQDDIIDSQNHALLEQMIKIMMSERRMTRGGMEIILAGRHFERMGDEAVNICEEVVFMVEGTIIRHQPESPPSP